MFDTRGVSRERIIGISFVDILIQAVFLLLLILIIGYVDPIESLKIKEYEAIGKDLCEKLKKDSPKACREYVENANIGPIEKSDFNKIGSDVCKKLGKNTEKDCRDALSKFNSLWPCIQSKNKVKAPWAVSWDINSLTTAKFLGFSSEYIEYLNNQKDTARLGFVKEANQFVGMTMGSVEIESRFSFIRESECFHEVAETRSIPVSDQQIASLRSAIYNLRKINGN